MSELDNILAGLTPDERNAVALILQQQQTTGASALLNEIVAEDYEEYPVTVAKFISDPRYAGNYLSNMYPYWKKQLSLLFDAGKHYSEVAFTGSIGIGKGAPLDSLLLGPNGYYPMKNVSIGSKVFGQDGKVYDVTGVWPQGERTTYAIGFDDGSDVICDENHNWYISTNVWPSAGDRRSEDPTWRTVNTKQLLKIFRERKYTALCIPCTEPIQFTKKPLKIPPYVLGHMIMNGGVDKDDVVLHAAYPRDVKDRIRLCLSVMGFDCKEQEDLTWLGTDLVIPELAKTVEIPSCLKFGVEGVGLHGRIPSEYLYSNVADRVDLFHGIMDAQLSTFSNFDSYIHCQLLRRSLVTDFTFLVNSLGGLAITSEPSSLIYQEAYIQRLYVNPKNVVDIRLKLPRTLLPYWSSELNEASLEQCQQSQCSCYRRIVSIENAGKQLTQCITVNNPKSLYIMNNVTVTHNSSIAIVAIAYELYKLMCLRDPQRFYGTNKTIFVAFFNNTIELARSVGFNAIHDLIRKSDWFMTHGKMEGRVNEVYKPYKDIELIAGSQSSHIIGKDVFVALIDEINFAKSANVHMEQSKIMQLYNNIYERIVSRFTRNGEVHGTLFLVSSKKSEYDFLESYIRKQKGKPHVFVADAKLWEVKGGAAYSGKTFKLAVGGSNLPSKIIPDNEDPAEYSRLGYEVMDVPIEHKQSFELDMQAALMNVAGVSITHVLKFLTIDQIQKCYTSDVNPFTEEVIEIGLHDDKLLSDYFDASKVSELIYSKPIFVHLDMAVSGDNAGIGAVAAMGYRDTSEYSIQEGRVVATKKMVYRHVFQVEIAAPKNDQIHFGKVRDFLYHLKNRLGYNIKAVSTDGFNCLPATAELITSVGVRRITDLQLENEVLTYDLETGTYQFSKFTNLRETGKTQKLYHIDVSDFDIIECTANHPILTVDGYKRADKLEVGDYLVSYYPHTKRVLNISVDYYEDKQPVYDIEVPKYHNFVLSSGVVVHNSVDMRQQLEIMGFNVDYVSLDRTPDGYMALKSAIAERRVALLQLPKLEVELVQLERDNVTGKIDHPLTGCFTSDTKICVRLENDACNTMTIAEMYDRHICGQLVLVLTFNEYSHRTEYMPIKSVFFTKFADIVEISLDNGELIHCTYDHKFLVNNFEWKRAELLTCDDVFVDSPVSVRSVTHHRSNVPVFDISVMCNHNFKLAAGVFAHNSKDGADGLAGALYNALKHKNDLAADVSDIVDIMLEANTDNTVVSEDSEPIDAYSKQVLDQMKQAQAEKMNILTAEQIKQEAKRRSDINYGRESVSQEQQDIANGIIID